MTLSDERLAEIRARYDAVYEDLDPQHGARWDEMAVEELEHIGELLAEVDRLHAELAAALKIVRAMARGGLCSCGMIPYNVPANSQSLAFAPLTFIDASTIQHRADCHIAQARALLASVEADTGAADRGGIVRDLEPYIDSITGE